VLGKLFTKPPTGDMRDPADDPEHLFTRGEVWRIALLVVGAVLALIGTGAAEGLLMR
jgi:hypothetical protein